MSRLVSTDPMCTTASVVNIPEASFINRTSAHICSAYEHCHTKYGIYQDILRNVCKSKHSSDSAYGQNLAVE